tara:strand:- start:2095 stop:2628 length:534 start_codon:yes stop_codon:yes gene_type:complete
MGKKITLAELADNLEAASSGDILQALHREALRYAAKSETVAKKMASSGGSGLTPRTGRLVGSIQGRVVRKRHEVNIRLQAGGTGLVKYAGVHEQDGKRGSFITIKPKRAKYLVFPVSADAFTGAGVARGGGAGSEWVSVKQVRIPARPYLRPTWKLIQKLVIKDVRKALKKEVLQRG